MTTCPDSLWERYQSLSFSFPAPGLTLDLSRVAFPEGFLDGPDLLKGAFQAMAQLESGAIANPDENRMVGHYWLRAPHLAPSAALSADIASTTQRIKQFAGSVHAGMRRGAGGPFKNILIIGIGGSALGPQFVAAALGGLAGEDRMKPWFLDNTDPAGIDRVIAEIGDELNRTLCVVISKSGKTSETRNGMLEAQAAYQNQGLRFNQHAIAITQTGSTLDSVASSEEWLERFPMWDWVGGRTSETSVVGLLPAALQGIDIDSFLQGAAACDAVTRIWELKKNPAALLALSWYHGTGGRGAKNMVILPYKDRLELFAKYLQQLIMESLGKQLDINGLEVNQGIAVLGNKGSTDQHSYVQQLVDGVENAFVTFVQVARDRTGRSIQVEPDITSGDYLHGFLLGTREALRKNGRDSITIGIPEVSPFTVGALIALFERTVGFYASLTHINAYHQPGVEAGKKAAGVVIDLTQRVIRVLRERKSEAFTVAQLAGLLHAAGSPETVFHICEHLAANPDRGVVRIGAEERFQARYQFSG